MQDGLLPGEWFPALSTCPFSAAGVRTAERVPGPQGGASPNGPRHPLVPSRPPRGRPTTTAEAAGSDRPDAGSRGDPRAGAFSSGPSGHDRDRARDRGRPRRRGCRRIAPAVRRRSRPRRISTAARVNSLRDQHTTYESANYAESPHGPARLIGVEARTRVGHSTLDTIFYTRCSREVKRNCAGKCRAPRAVYLKSKARLVMRL
jgi:hypothetical protein